MTKGQALVTDQGPTIKFCKGVGALLRACSCRQTELLSLEQEGTVPSEEFASDRDTGDEAEFRIVTRRDCGDAEVRICFQCGEGLTNVSGEKIFVRCVEAFSAGDSIEGASAKTRTEEMKGREFVSAPGRKPVGPAEIEGATRFQTAMKMIQKAVGLGEVFINVGADDKIEFAEGRKIVGIDVELLKGVMSEAFENMFMFIRKSDIAALAEKFITEDSVAASEVDGLDGRA